MSTPETAGEAATLTRETAVAAARIQSCGFLVAVDQDWRVRHVSANIADHFADCGRAMAGQPLADVFGAAAVHSLRNQVALMRDPAGSARLFSLVLASVPKPFDVAMHRSGKLILLELLPAAHGEAGDPIGTAIELFRQLDGDDDPEALSAHAARQLRALTGFERVTIFRIPADGAAQMVASDTRGGLPPAAACPPASPRAIADAGSASVGLEPGAEPSLLDRALLRPCASDELALLEREGAAASLVTPLRSAGRDWGLAVCLNRAPRRLPLDRMAAAILFSEMLAMRFEIAALRRG